MGEGTPGFLALAGLAALASGRLGLATLAGGHLLAQLSQDGRAVLFLQLGRLLFHLSDLLAEFDEFVHAGFFLKRLTSTYRTALLRYCATALLRPGQRADPRMLQRYYNKRTSEFVQRFKASFIR